jgi:hypothetical protein
MEIEKIKIQPCFFDNILYNNKRFEVRYKGDRIYRHNDIKILGEFMLGLWTGREITIRINYFLDDVNFCKDGYVIFGFDILTVRVFP